MKLIQNTNGIPYEVATRMLATPGLRLTNRQRKNFQEARCKRYESDTAKRPLEEHFERKFKSSTWAQLLKWKRRGTNVFNSTQSAVRLISERLEDVQTTKVDQKDKALVVKTGAQIVLLEKALAALAVRGAQIQAFLDGVENEIDRRKEFIRKLKGVCFPVAEVVEWKLCPA